MSEKKKYTIIYTIFIGGGAYIVQHDRVETDDLKKTLMEDEYTDTWMVFEGWPPLEGEYADLDSPVEVNDE